jgi:hypothetical protein
VDQKLALVEAGEEQVVGIAADHFTICGLLDTDGQPHPIVVEKVRSMIEDAVNTVQERIQACQWYRWLLS